MSKRLLKLVGDLEERVGANIGESESAVFGVCDINRKVVKRLKIVGNTAIETDEEATIMIPERLEKLLYPKRLKVIYGGRGSGKTRTVTSILTERARFNKERIICLREIMKSIQDSSYQELVDEINRKGHAEDFRVIENKITSLSTLATFRFDGLYRNQTKIKGYAGATLAWIEEAENVSQVSWDITKPTIRAPGSEIWITFNPNKEDDPTWTSNVQPYVDKMVGGIYEDENTLIIECNHCDNPWFTKELQIEMDIMRKTDYDRYMWIWEGQLNKRQDEQVLGGKWRIDNFEPSDKWSGPYFGADFGFSNDPSTIVVCWIDTDNNTLYISHEGGGAHIEIDDLGDLYEKVYPGIKKKRIKADCSRPETISYIKRQGFDIYGAKKWSGSVEDGVAHLRAYNEIVVHSRCKETAKECKNYSYKVDKLTGDVLTDIVDDWNHYIDALRYALDGIIKNNSPQVYVREKYR